MTPFRKHVALAVDGGGIKGLIVAQALPFIKINVGTRRNRRSPVLKNLFGLVQQSRVAPDLRCDQLMQRQTSLVNFLMSTHDESLIAGEHPANPQTGC